MVRAVNLVLVMYANWLLFSGHYDRLLLSLGFASTLVAVAIALRMDIVDRETYPVPLNLRALTYWLWLAGEVIKANLDVARRILSPSLPISPSVVLVKASQRTDLGRVTYGNSITLTPGTITIDLEGDTLEVHALTREAAEVLQQGEMDRRVTEMEGYM
ncbi:MAG: Na+/H+ antiporter subunit E [Gammaproteobacteria bacterium]|nr:Na+/H+ antiporter subunit E [Gammaproteobacteria bacterium]